MAKHICRALSLSLSFCFCPSLGYLKYFCKRISFSFANMSALCMCVGVCLYMYVYIYRLLCRFADRWRLRACLADFNKLLTLALCRTRGSAEGRVAACVAQTNTQAYIHTTHCYLPHTQTHTHTPTTYLHATNCISWRNFNDSQKKSAERGKKKESREL